MQAQSFGPSECIRVKYVLSCGSLELNDKLVGIKSIITFIYLFFLLLFLLLFFSCLFVLIQQRESDNVLLTVKLMVSLDVLVLTILSC